MADEVQLYMIILGCENITMAKRVREKVEREVVERNTWDRIEPLDTLGSHVEVAITTANRERVYKRLFECGIIGADRLERALRGDAS